MGERQASRMKRLTGFHRYPLPDPAYLSSSAPWALDTPVILLCQYRFSFLLQGKKEKGMTSNTLNPQEDKHSEPS